MQSKEPVFEGVAVALVTLFDPAGGVDVTATAQHASRLVDLGIAAVVVAGTTGEAAALQTSERIELTSAISRVVDVPVVVGTGAPSARQAAVLATEAIQAGADALLALSPPGAADPSSYYKSVREAAGSVPLLAYHYPVASSPGVPVDVLAQLPVDGLKDSSGDPTRLLAELEVFDRPIYPGSSALLSIASGLGCRGVIVALANVEPEACIEAFAGSHSAQRRLAGPHLKSLQDFPVGLKRMVSDRFQTSAVTRL